MRDFVCNLLQAIFIGAVLLLAVLFAFGRLQWAGLWDHPVTQIALAAIVARWAMDWLFPVRRTA